MSKIIIAVTISFVVCFFVGALITISNENLYITEDSQLIFQPVVFLLGSAALGVILARSREISAVIRGIPTIGIMAFVLGAMSPGFWFNTMLFQVLAVVVFVLCYIFAKDKS